MAGLLALLYGGVCYLVFLATFLYAIWFVWTMDRPAPQTSVVRALLIDAGLLALFAVQHSGMARQGFKRVWTRLIPQPIERSTYVLFASLALLVMIVFWQPIPVVVWQVESPAWRMVLQVLFWIGWANLLFSTLLIDHFDLFGLRQVARYFRAKPYNPPRFRTPGTYKIVRHPLYLGFLIAFWSAPRMTVGHLFFSAMCTGFILVAIHLEERDLVRYFGVEYERYKKVVPMLIPRRMSKYSTASVAPPEAPR